MPCTEPSASLSRVAHRLVPQAQRLELGDQVAVHLEEVARQRLALEQVRDLRLDALVAAGDRGDGGGRRDGDQQRVAQPVLAMRARSASQRRGPSGVDAPGVELQLAPRGARLGEGRVRALLARPARPRPTARGSRSPRRCAARASRASAQSKGSRSWKKTSCRPISPRPTGRQRRFDARGVGDRVEVEVDHPVELTHRACAPCAPACRSRRRRAVRADVVWRAEVDRAEVADRGLGVRVTSRISVQRLERWTRAPGQRRSGCRRGCDLSLKVIQPLPVWASVRIIRA